MAGDVNALIEPLKQHGAALVFVNVALEQLGLPVPSTPTLVAAGSLLVGVDGFLALVALVVLACAIADAVWYAIGRAAGYRVLGTLCRLSINPGSCVSLAEVRFRRWGVVSLLFAKFIPGFGTVARPIAGAMRMPIVSFAAAAIAGAILWAVVAVGLGWLLHERVGEALGYLAAHGASATAVVALLLVGYVGIKWRQRDRILRLDRIPRIEAAELAVRMRASDAPVLIDVRAMPTDPPPIPGALLAERDRLSAIVAGIGHEREIVTYCACPHDASAADAARRLMRAGFVRVRPLGGGIDAWLAHAARGAAGRGAAVHGAAVQAAEVAPAAERT